MSRVKWMRVGAGVAVVVVIIAAAMGVWNARWGVRRNAERVTGNMEQRAYVWQRGWNDALRERLRDVGPVKGLVVLAAEMTWPGMGGGGGDAGQGGKVNVAWVRMDEDSLKGCGRPVGLAIRINAFRGDYADAGEEVAQVAARVVRQARDAGLRIGELQLDYDCPTSKLAGYQLWVRQVKEAMVKRSGTERAMDEERAEEVRVVGGKVEETRVVVTVLPSWMGSEGFGALVREADGFVLQVHSVERPADAEHVPALCDSRKAERWVEQAGGYGVGFEVALPTYAYVLGFDERGKFVGAGSEGGREWGAGVKLKRLGADAEAMAGLVKRWTKDRPATMRGLIWYRLPIESDAMNWRWKTLTGVMESAEKGMIERGQMRVELERAEAGWVDVKLRNVGGTDVPMYVRVALKWTGDEPTGRDVLGGFAEGERGEGKWILQAGDDLRATVLGAGRERTIAWMRFETNREVRADVESMEH